LIYGDDPLNTILAVNEEYYNNQQTEILAIDPSSMRTTLLATLPTVYFSTSMTYDPIHQLIYTAHEENYGSYYQSICLVDIQTGQVTQFEFSDWYADFVLGLFINPSTSSLGAVVKSNIRNNEISIADVMLNRENKLITLVMNHPYQTNFTSMYKSISKVFLSTNNNKGFFIVPGVEGSGDFQPYLVEFDVTSKTIQDVAVLESMQDDFAVQNIEDIMYFP